MRPEGARLLDQSTTRLSVRTSWIVDLARRRTGRGPFRIPFERGSKSLSKGKSLRVRSRREGSVPCRSLPPEDGSSAGRRRRRDVCGVVDREGRGWGTEPAEAGGGGIKASRDEVFGKVAVETGQMHGNSNRSSVVEGVGSNATSTSARETRGGEVEMQGRAKGRRCGVQNGPWWERPMYIRSSQGRELEQECTRRYPSGFRQKACQAQSGPNVKTGWNQHIVASQKKTAKNHDYTMNRIKPNLKPGKVHSVIHGQNFDADVGPGCSAYKQTKPGKNIGKGVISGASLLRHIIRTTQRIPTIRTPPASFARSMHVLFLSIPLWYCSTNSGKALKNPQPPRFTRQSLIRCIQHSWIARMLEVDQRTCNR